jgi:peptidyl-prolyl cis-trans isomerase SurA
MKASRFGVSVIVLATAGLVGCSNRQASSPQPLTPEAFIHPRAGTTSGAGTAEGSGGTVGAGEAARPAVQIPVGRKPAPQAPTTAPAGSGPRSEAPPVDTGVTGTATASPAGAGNPPIGASSGQFMTLGGVVAEVNGTPIYANKVLSVLEPILREKAKKYDAENFRRQAKADIDKRIEELVRIELFYAAAQRTLDAEDKRLADLLTVQWRMQQITRAGGSVELARRKAREEFQADFDELAHEQSRNELLRIYDQKKIVPRIQVSAGDIREYYDKHVKDQFSATEKVKFRLLKVDIAKTGGKEQAIAKIDDKLKRARAGEDFAEMTRKENDERLFATKDALDMNPESFAVKPVREALSKLQPGQVSDPIADPTGFYLVKLEERTPGRVRPFEEQAVQDEIRRKLRMEQYGRLRQQDLSRLIAGSVVKPSMEVLAGVKPPTPAEAQMMNIALDMAMQKYYQYAAK